MYCDPIINGMNGKVCFIRGNQIVGHYDEQMNLMQWTGLKDKNGKEIYEGDIITYYNDKYTVEFSKRRAGYFPFANDDGCGCCAYVIADPDISEVIGNIYENPELLEDVP